MRNLKLTTLLLVTFHGCVVIAQAQSTGYHSTLVDQYYQNTDATHSDAWWKALESTLTLSVEQSIDSLDDEAIGHIIFFSSQQRENVDLRDAIAPLLAIYAGNEDPGVRVMVVAALNAIGDKEGIEDLKRLSPKESTHLLKHVTEAAFRQHGIR